uniref:Solute carrier family 19 member 1 n=1 Tax=Propithecus coquereli TaxID=379532 RepID=A0A2K6GW05_PROCO
MPSSPTVEKQAPAEAGPDLELQSWRCLVFYLCFYGFMAQMRPGESFITPYLLGPSKNFTQEQVTNEIMPVLSYSYMLVLVPVFLLTDYLRYKPVLLLQGLSFVCVWLLLLQGRSVLHMQLMELFYSVTMAARIAYSSYIFSLVRPARYQRMAGYSRAAVLLGVFTSSVLGQLLVTAGGVSFTTLNYVSLGFLIFSLLLALFLKRPKRSLFFNRGAPLRGASPSELGPMRPGPAPRGKLRAACRDFVLVRMLRELGASLRLPQLRVWSLWWVFNSAGVLTCAGPAARVAAPSVAAPALPPQSDPGLHLPFSFQIASSLSKELCALVFGVNTFFATILKTVITLIVSDKRGLGLVVHSQVSPCRLSHPGAAGPSGLGWRGWSRLPTGLAPGAPFLPLPAGPALGPSALGVVVTVAAPTGVQRHPVWL